MKTDSRKNYPAIPNGVQRAVIMLWASIGIGIINSRFLVSHSTPGGLWTEFVIAGIVAMIGAGRNWARITLLALFLPGLVLMIVLLPLLLRVNGTLSLVVMAAQTLLQTVAVILLFQREASQWFRGGQRPPLTPQNPIRPRTPYSYARYQ